MATTYAVEGAFKYDFKNRKIAYITSIVIAGITVILAEAGAYLIKEDFLDLDGLTIGAYDVIRLAGLIVHFFVL